MGQHKRMKHRISQRDGNIDSEDENTKEPAKEQQCVCCELPHHQCTRYKCGGCGINFYNEDDLTNHELEEHPLMCHMCYNFFPDSNSKQNHWIEKHFKIDGAL